MILLDYSGTMFSSIYVAVQKEKNCSIDYLRHIIFNQIRATNRKFKDKYGEMILCLDTNSNNGWRKKIFPYYKAGRAEARAASGINWDLVWENVHQIKSEMLEVLPYKMLSVQECEADDVIAVLATHANQLEGTEDMFGETSNTKVLCCSNDKDFRQLHKYPWIEQYFPVKGKIIKENNPEGYLWEQVLRGDKADGIPNICSDPDTFVELGKRQAPITTKMIREWKENGVPEKFQERYKKNKMLIDLSEIPEKYVSQILDAYKNAVVNSSKAKLMAYFMKNRMDMQLDRIQDF